MPVMRAAGDMRMGSALGEHQQQFSVAQQNSPPLREGVLRSRLRRRRQGYADGGSLITCCQNLWPFRLPAPISILLVPRYARVQTGNAVGTIGVGSADVGLPKYSLGGVLCYLLYSGHRKKVRRIRGRERGCQIKFDISPVRQSYAATPICVETGNILPCEIGGMRRFVDIKNDRTAVAGYRCATLCSASIQNPEIPVVNQRHGQLRSVDVKHVRIVLGVEPLTRIVG